MAGFGGFGGANNNNNPFGAPPPAGPFGSTPSGFGAAPAVAPPANNNPFGAAPAAGFPPFGSPPGAAPPTMPFGATNNAPTAPGFGAASSPFGNTAQQQQQQQAPPNNNSFGGGGGGGGGFGNNNNNAPQPFGTTAPPNSFGAPSTGPTTTSGFGSLPAATTFAAPSSAWQPPTNTPFGNTAASSVNPFGVPAPSAPPAMTPFGTAATSSSTFPLGNAAPANNNNPFGNTSQSSGGSMAAPNPFAPTVPPATAAPLVFGSANPHTDSDMDGGGGVGPFGQSSSTNSNNTPFGQATMTSSGLFGQSTTSSSATNGAFGSAAAPATSNPFGQISSTGNNPFASPSPTNQNDKKKKSKPPRSDLPFATPQHRSNFGGGSSGNDDDGMTGSAWPPPPNLVKSAGLGGGGGGNADDEERKKKMALLEKKKKRLEELKRRKEAKAESPKSTSPTLNAGAAPFMPSAPPPPADASLAERNAARFDPAATNSATRAYLPSDLQAKAGQQVDYSKLRSSGTGDRENLDEAKSLVGTCPHMCPDEELLRRENEGDIQLLELVQPGKLHPDGWTLRNTAIKRFRRSAADYKLDVPEWVRPPDVLENVCGYLEEWIMVRAFCVFD